MIDSHVHLDDSRFSDSDRQKILDDLTADGLRAVINVACDLKSMRFGARLAEDFKRVFFTVGCHPHDAESYNVEFEREIEALAARPKAVAMGEIGLDYHYDFSERKIQREIFARQLWLAKELKLPVVLHVREAWKDALDLLAAQGDFSFGLLLHCFSGSRETAEILTRKYDAYFSFGGAVTFGNFGGGEVVRAVPSDRLLAETDCPYMTPVPFRGKTNRPAYVRFVIEQLAQLRGASFEETERLTEKNTIAFFRLKEV